VQGNRRAGQVRPLVRASAGPIQLPAVGRRVIVALRDVDSAARGNRAGVRDTGSRRKVDGEPERGQGAARRGPYCVGKGSECRGGESGNGNISARVGGNRLAPTGPEYGRLA